MCAGYTSSKEGARNAALYLDKRRPGWHERIDPLTIGTGDGTLIEGGFWIVDQHNVCDWLEEIAKRLPETKQVCEERCERKLVSV